MKEAIKGKKDIAQLFAEAYQINQRSDGRYRPGTMVALACGGCAACRREKKPPYANPLPVCEIPWKNEVFQVNQELSQLLDGEKSLTIFYDFV